MSIQVSFKEDGFAGLPQLDPMMTGLNQNNGTTKDFSQRVLSTAKTSPEKQSKLPTIAIRAAEPLVNIPKEQLEHHTTENLYKMKSQSAQGNSLLEPFHRLILTPDKTSSPSGFRKAKLREEVEVKESPTLIQTEVLNLEAAVSIYETDTSPSPDIHQVAQLASVTTVKPTDSSTNDVIDFHDPELRKPILPFLKTSHMFAQCALREARKVYIFHMQSIHIARQAVKLVLRLNKAAHDDPLNDDPYRAKLGLQDELMDLIDSVDKWGAEDRAMEERDERLEEIRKQYDIFFRPRFYSQQEPDYKFLAHMVAYDDGIMEYYQRERSRAGPAPPMESASQESHAPGLTDDTFEPLVRILSSLRNKGDLCPRVVTVEPELASQDAYGRAGATGFREYIGYAKERGIVLLGGSSDGPNKEWIELVDQNAVRGDLYPHIPS